MLGFFFAKWSSLWFIDGPLKRIAILFLKGAHKVQNFAYLEGIFHT